MDINDTNPSIRLLLLEDNKDDAEITQRELRKVGFALNVQRVETRDAFVRALADFLPDLVIADYKLPSFDGRAALAIVRRDYPDLPVIMVSGTLGDEQAVELIKAGADDFLLKDRLARFGSAVQAALARAAERRAHRMEWLRFRTLIENVSDVIAILDCKGVFRYASPAIKTVGGFKPEELVGQQFEKWVHPDEVEPARQIWAEVLAHPGMAKLVECRCRHKDGTWPIVEARIHNLLHLREIGGLLMVFRDISGRKAAAESLRVSEERFRTLTMATSHMVWGTNAAGEALSDFPVWRDYTGQSRDEFMGAGWANAVHPDDRKRAQEDWQRAVAAGALYETELRIRRRDGLYRHFAVKGVPIKDKGGAIREWIGTCTDITERKLADEVIRRSLEESICAVARAIEQRDPYTAGHQSRVAHLAAAIACALGLGADRIRGLELAAEIHDLGKIHVPADLLAKPGRLTRLEFEIVKTHAEAGHDILKGVHFVWPIADIVWQHHERLDGSGYPRGLKAGQILLESKILAVADVVEAMTGPRPYRDALGVETGLAEIVRGRGILYDADAVDACVKLFHEGYRFPAAEADAPPGAQRADGIVPSAIAA